MRFKGYNKSLNATLGENLLSKFTYIQSSRSEHYCLRRKKLLTELLNIKMFYLIFPNCDTGAQIFNERS